MSTPSTKASISLDDAAKRMKPRVDQLLAAATEAKASLGTNYNTLLTLPAYIKGFSDLVAWLNAQDYFPEVVGPEIIRQFPETPVRTWETEGPKYAALKAALPPLDSYIRANASAFVLTIGVNGERDYITDAGAEINGQLSTLLSAVTSSFG